jgi:ATP-dependent helicase/nuclease subunit B
VALVREQVVPGVTGEAALARTVAGLQGEDRSRAVFVVARTPLVAGLLRRRLVAIGPIAGAQVTTLRGLIESLARLLRVDDDREPLTEMAIRAAARMVLNESPGCLRDVATHQSSEEALAASYRRWIDWGAPGRHGEQPSAGPKAADVIRLLAQMAGALEASFYDPRELLGRVSDAVARHAGGGLPPVVVYLPDPIGLLETELLARLGEATEVRVVEGELDASHPPRFDRLISAPDADVEVAEAVRRLLAHAEGGGDLSRCLVTYPEGSGATAIGARLRGAFARAGLPIGACEATPLGETPEGRALQGVLAFALAAGRGEELPRAEVIRWMSGGGVRGGRMTRDLVTAGETGTIPLGLWDRCSRAAGVLGGLDQWRERLASYAATGDDRTGEGSGGAYLVAGTSVDGCHDLLTFVERLHSLSASVATASWSAAADWLSNAVGELMGRGPTSDALRSAVAELVTLEAVEPLGDLSQAARLERVASALAVALDVSGDEPASVGRGPVVGPLGQIAGVSSEVLVVLDCREGSLPGVELQDPLVTDADLAALAGEVISAREALASRQRRHLEFALAGAVASQASFPRIAAGARRTGFVSRWLEDDLFDGEPVEIGSYHAALRRVAAGRGPALDIGELELAAVAVGSGRRRSDFIAEMNEDFGRRARGLRARRRGGLSRFGGYVGPGAAAEEVWDRKHSATALESFARCPFSFFANRLLRVEELPAPEEVVLVDARERGTLMHDVLEAYFAPYAEAGEVPRFDAAESRRLAELAEEHFAALEAVGKTGTPLFWAGERRTIGRDLQRYVAKDVAHAQSARLVPVAVELDFGRETEPVAIAAAGRNVYFRGRIDRLDQAPDGSVVVADYKSGRSDGFKDIAKRPLGRGTHLQLPIYAKAAKAAVGGDVAARAEYRFVQATSNYDVVPIELTEELDAELAEVLGVLVSTVAAGAFPPRPGAQGYLSQYEHCRFCDYDPVCASDRTAVWARATWDPLLRPYVDLVEPPIEIPDEPGSSSGGTAGSADAVAPPATGAES